MAPRHGRVITFLKIWFLIGSSGLRRQYGAIRSSDGSADARRPIITVHTARACELSARRYLVEAYLRPTVVLVILGSLAAVLLLLGAGDSLVTLLASAALLGLVWIPLCWWIGFVDEDRSVFQRLIGDVWSRLPFGMQAAATGSGC